MPMTPICSICCDHYTPNSVIKTTKCGHIFHSDCILRWLRSNTNCPECRQYGPVLFKVYLNFNSSDTEQPSAVARKTKHSNEDQAIETLTVQLSLEEAKNKNLEKRLKDSERKLRQQIENERIKYEKQENLLKDYIESIENIQILLDDEVKRREIAEKAQRSLSKELDGNNIRQQKPSSSTNKINACQKPSTSIKPTTMVCPHHNKTRCSAPMSATQRAAMTSHSSGRNCCAYTPSSRKITFECNFVNFC